MNRHERDLLALQSIARVLATQIGQHEMLLNVLDLLEEQLGLLRGTILLLSPDGRELMLEAVRTGPGGIQHEVRYQRGEGIVGRVIESGEPVILPRITESSEFLDRIHQRYLSNGESVSFICVPIIVGNEVAGTLSADLAQPPAGPAGNGLDDELEDYARVLGIVAAMIAGDVSMRRAAQLEREALEGENSRLRSELRERAGPENMIGHSKAMRDVYRLINQVAQSDTTVLIRGESGTGKELVAAAIHYTSRRAERPFIKVNCAALSESLLESELFGHEKGAFTGAVYQRNGRIEEAEGGTLFLDEIGDFSPAVQVKLLRVLQEREFERVGSNQTRKADVRIITATNRNLEKAVQDRAYRQDLYYRINVFPIHLAPLRERRDDILLLANHFTERFAREMDKPIRRISTPAINMLLAYHWPGNVRELENCIEHAVLLARDDTIHGHCLPPSLQMPAGGETSPRGTLKMHTQALERDLIVDALKRSGGNIAAASRELGITARMVRYKLEKLDIDYRALFKQGRP